MTAGDSHNSDDNLPLVLVTGASGFIALHCVKKLLEGPYRVRGTVRNKDNQKKIAPLLRLPNASTKIELVEADLLQPVEKWKEVVAGCTYVLHIASPLNLNATEEIVATAVQGTKAVMEAATACPEVKKIVLTSSCAAINREILSQFTQQDGVKNKAAVFDETFWSDIAGEKEEWYAVSKTLAEKAAWDHWNSLSESTRPAFTVLCPSVVFGPVLSDAEHISASILKRLMKRSTSLAHPKASLSLVDVRDVAEAHVRALERPETDGERILITASPSAWFADIARWLKKGFSRYGYGITTWECPNWVLKLYAASGIDPESKSVVSRLGPELRFDNSKSIRLLGLEYRRMENAVKEMMHSMIDQGMVKPTEKYKRKYQARNAAVLANCKKTKERAV
ncbi:hypothetical protein PMAYCL1PPCAC_08501 [Pristionchus mayeri]|uniref:NAD-dependent epimerase/dehydratase domain-containing protein n=1 Tax=Pristionchus mayeri TaxID=1317129 RepID=A0AAN4ZFS3_9BILA|nr:hypothetical protein PMAYCL1PPCAC_08501 [Pristionchus mayeri]